MSEPLSPEKKRAFETFETTITEVLELTPRVHGIRFQLPAGKTISFHSGQFVQVFIPTPEKLRRTSYSIASAPFHTDYFDLCVTLVTGGVSSTFLHHLKVGEKVQVMGPLGKFSLNNPATREQVFIATGSGIAPFRSMIHDLHHSDHKGSVRLIFGNRFEEDIIYRKDWDVLAAKWPNLKNLFTLSKPGNSWKGESGYVQDKIQGFVPDPRNADFYICGLVKMIDAVQEKLLSLGVPKEQIHFERYD